MEHIKDINLIRDWFQDLAHEIHFLKMGILAGYKTEELEKMCVAIRGKCLTHEKELFELKSIKERVRNYVDRFEDAKTTEQPTSEEACRAALLNCVEALETAQPYVESSGWTRHRDAEIAQIEEAITNARKALGE